MLQGRDRSEIAGLARIVAEHAAAGDGVAVRLVCEAADALAETLYDVVDRLGVSESELPLIAAGSLARRSQAYWSHLCKRAAAFAPRLSPVVPSRREVVGAMVAAAPGIPALADGFRERLVASTSDNG
jgi:N-acetylglucosamine kinase-like BadF-type ATPase